MLVAAVAGCGGGSGKLRATSSNSPSTPVSTSAPATTAGVPATAQTTVPPAQPAGGPLPAGGPVPAGFSPASVTAVSTSTFWVLGTAPCRVAPCTSLVRTSDGGAHFVGLPAPHAPLAHQEYPGAAPAGAVSELRFADGTDGWAFGPALYSTHDGGAHWHEVSVPGEVLDLAAAAGQVWALGGACQPEQGCSSFWLERSPVGRDDFTPVALPVPMTGPAPTPTIALQGSTLYLMVNSVSTGAKYHSTVLASTDGGGHFSRYQAPCTVDLGGSLSAAPNAGLWAVCPTGTMSGVWRSTDGGASFEHVRTPMPTPNSAVVAAAGTSGAVLAVPGPDLQATSDGGQHWGAGKLPANLTRQGAGVYYVGMSDASVGFALVSGQGGQDETLLRTTDGGLQWSGVAF